MPAELKLLTLSPSLKHWPVPLAAGAFVVVTGLACLAFLVASPPTTLVIVCVGVALTVYPALKAGNAEYVVTNLRVVVTSGLLRKTSRSLPVEEVRDVRIEWGLFGRALGVAALRVQGAGGALELEGVEEPEKVREKILSLR